MLLDGVRGVNMCFYLIQESRAIAERTARCRCHFRYYKPTYRILQQHRAVSLPLTARLSCWSAVTHLSKSDDK